MALDARISMMGQAPNVGQAINIFENALMNSQKRDIRQQQADQQALINPLQVQQAQQSVDAGAAQAKLQEENRILRNVSEFSTKLKPVLQSGDTDMAQGMLAERLLSLQEQGLPTNETVSAITSIRSGDVNGVLRDIDSIQTIAQQRGLTGSSLLSVGQRDFNSNVAAVKADPNLETTEGKAASVALGLTAKASLTKDERAANDEELGKRIADQKAAESLAAEAGKLTAQLKFKPQITKAVKLAEKEATERGDVLNDLSRAEAGLPGLIKATDNLKELAVAATSTYGGRFFDLIAKESGWGSTKGANARTKYIAIIDNQVLPLLKQTFGGAMTEGEGLRLSNTFGDPNATPEQKMLQTEAFIEQKLRDIERLKAQANAGQAQIVDIQSEQENAVDLGTLSIEELIAERNRLGGQ